MTTLKFKTHLRFFKKPLQKGLDRTYLNITKVINDKFTANIILNGGN